LYSGGAELHLLPFACHISLYHRIQVTQDYFISRQGRPVWQERSSFVFGRCRTSSVAICMSLVTLSSHSGDAGLIFYALFVQYSALLSQFYR
jgi:hypothetical protein